MLDVFVLWTNVLHTDCRIQELMLSNAGRTGLDPYIWNNFAFCCL